MITLLVLLACNDPKVEDSAVVYTGPVLVHTPPASVGEGASLTIDVTATDPDGVGTVSLYHRRAGDTGWTLEPMVHGEGDLFSVTLSGDDVEAPALEYYVKAVDAGEVAANSYLPEESTAAPFSVPVTVQGQALPFVEDFELEASQASLPAIGWANASGGFRGAGWDLTAQQVHGGTGSVLHGPGGQAEVEMEDWLISPALDFSGVTDAQVTWWERGSNTARADHALYVSTGSRDPDGGDWVTVGEALPAPAEAAWGRSAVVDLSAWAGQPTVYLAWKYTGVSADSWWIDDVRVEALQPDVTPTVTVTPTPLDPGATGLFTVDLVNTGAVAATDVAVSVVFPDGGASTDEESVPVTIDAGGTLSVPFTLHVDETTPDNSYVPYEVQVALPAGPVTLADDLLVGLASSAHIAWTGDGTGYVTLRLGVGDPAAPTWETEVYAGDDGAVSLDVDITDLYALLPPRPGIDRWYLGITGDGALEDFRVTWDGVDTVAGVLPTTRDSEETIVYLPTPPAPTGTFTTTPTILTPGAAGVTLSGTIRNEGAATTGPVTLTLSSSDPDVAVTNAGPVTLSASGLAAGETARFSGAFGFDVAGTHVDSTDVGLELTLSDDVESFVVPVELAVPWPVMRLAAVTIDDDGGDGILDPGEHAEVELRVANGGALPSAGIVQGTLAVDPSSAVTADVSTNRESYGTIGVGLTKSPGDPWDVTATSGSEGEVLDLVLSLYDSTRTYTVLAPITLGEPPWQPLDASFDPTGDVLGTGDFDFVSARWRVMDGMLQLEFTSATAFNPSRLFIESWMSSPGASWIYYRLVLQSGVVELQGYGSSGFTDISEPGFSFPDATTVRFDLAIADMDLRVNQLSLGLAAGWCGPPDYYCDHYPDGWGYPYDSWNPGAFFDLNW